MHILIRTLCLHVPYIRYDILTLYLSNIYSFKKALACYTKVNKIHLSMLRSLASQASVITEVVLGMGSILPAYKTSYNYIKSIFIEFVKQTGRLAVRTTALLPVHLHVHVKISLILCMLIASSRIQGEDALAKMTKLAYSHFSRGYFEKDKLLFSLMLTTEVISAYDNCNVVCLNFVNR